MASAGDGYIGTGTHPPSYQCQESMPTFSELRARTRYYESEEPWKTAHEEVNRLYALVSHILFGVSIFRLLIAGEKTWDASVAKGERQPNRSEVDEINALWRRWLGPCAAVEAAIRDFEAKGYSVEAAETFRKSCQYARNRPEKSAWRAVVSSPTAGFYGRPARTEADLRKKTTPFPDA